MLQDFRHSLRSLYKNPGFTIAAVVTLALGIGATTAVFSMVNAVLLRPLPYRDPSRLVTIAEASYDEFELWRASNRTFNDMAVFYRNIGVSRVALTGGQEPESVQCGFTSANLFPLLGVQPALGRTFTQEEVTRGEQVAVLSQSLSQRRFGKTIEIEGRAFRVIGVMPAGFDFPDRNVALWAPLTTNLQWALRAHDRVIYRWSVVGRLRDGVTMRSAQSELEAIGTGVAGRNVAVVPLHIEIGGNTRPSLVMLFGAVLFVLLIACTNVAGLMLARGAGREHEMAVRAALGAGRFRLARQLLTECATVALAAGSLGLALAWMGVRLIVAFGPHDIPRLGTAGLDGGALAFGFAVSLATAITFGLAPSLSASRRAVQGPKRAQRSPGLIRGPLVAAEVALAVMLLAGAGLLVRSFLRVLTVDPGFRPERALTVRISFPHAATAAGQFAFYERALDRLAALPGVEASGAGQSVLLDRSPMGNFGLREVEGRPQERRAQWSTPLMWTTIRGDYFRAMGTSLLAGRFFNEQDGPDVPLVAIVNETLAHRYWPGENPIGKRFKGQDARGHNDDWLTVAGLVRDMRRQELEKRPIAEVFQPQTQSRESTNALVVRTRIDPLKMAALVRETLRSVDASVVIAPVRTLEDQMDELLAGRRLETWLLGLFSAAAVLLAAIGLHGLLHYTVAQRTHEIGVRMALGADAGDIQKLVLREGLRLAILGSVAGLAGAWWLSKAIASLLYGVSAGDPAAFLFAVGILIAVALAASAIPAHRAARVDPLTALRHE